MKKALFLSIFLVTVFSCSSPTAVTPLPEKYLLASEVRIAAYHTSTINTNEAYFIELEITADANSRLATYNLGGIGSSTPQLVLVNGDKQISMSTQSPFSSAFVGPCEFITGGTIVVLDYYLPDLLEVLDRQLP